ncbi:LysR family transcriptional regulator [Luteolibacter pohnpeiensis]|uniref:LysR family transcriptional regulator n=1 Tax=Luteolibacter pohnpeiensis TaxID=454153 RepID=A0A934S2Y9_9BACT|nr:LysR family transcriptional regulator [Luteolibacter pohnpeiensis]MBK1881372.1 LysR family transcriptional regulator [Luteolibacter pohnpeiensis]
MNPDCPIRLIFSGDLSFGPGKAELLEKITELGSLNAAASSMDMSYMKAWKMIKSLNATFKEPLVELRRGGKAQGGAQLTATGEMVLSLYQQSVISAEKAVSTKLDQLKALMS